MLVSILSFVLAVLVIGIFFNVHVSQNSTIGPFVTGPVDPLNSKDNYLISIVDELIMGLHPNHTTTEISLQNSGYLY